ncbi:hypothetical protein KUTeg_011498 [Tegillarca granosa]|uniref:Uncharacterized protein n=1 Tax=Tegillarca granosa TaxID=220873 RepID=A0ABQ9F0T3_TEGGR|nr:hypothetical protein KUTeg_011498 [Tegillarca granosa]
MALRREVKQLKEELRKHKWSVEKISDNDSATSFYTGLPTFAVFVLLFQYLESKSSRMTYWTGESSTPSGDKSRSYSSNASLSPINQLLAVLIRNKIGLLCKMLGIDLVFLPLHFQSTTPHGFVYYMKN